MSDVKLTHGILTGKDWYKGFMNRHDRLSLKKAQQFPKVRKDARKPDIVYDFYKKWKMCVEAAEIPLVNGQYLVYNCDESGFNLDPTKVRGVGVKGVALHRTSGGSGRESISVLACVSAGGERLPPLIILSPAVKEFVLERKTKSTCCTIIMDVKGGIPWYHMGCFSARVDGRRNILQLVFRLFCASC